MFINVFYLAVVSACVSYTITEALLFEKLREFMSRRGRYLSDLFSCGYCFGFYVSALLEIIFMPNLFSDFGILGNVCTWFIISWISGIQYYIVCYLCKINCE